MNLKEKLQSFCVKCGKKISKGTLCESCYSTEKHLVFPSRILILRCAKCKKLLFKGHFLEENNELIKKLIEAQLQPLKEEIKKIDFKLIGEKLIISVSFKGKKFKEKKELPVKFQNTICDSCSRIAAGYFEAIIQLRLKEKNAEKKLKEFLNEISKKNPLAVIIKEQGTKEKKDFFIGSRKAAKQVVNKLKAEFNAKLLISFKQAGQKEGKLLKRMVYCLRN